MANEKDLALMSLYAYATHVNNTPILPSSWSLLRDRTEGTAGFAYTVLRNTSTNEIVIAFRGSDDGADWLGNSGISISQER